MIKGSLHIETSALPKSHVNHEELDHISTSTGAKECIACKDEFPEEDTTEAPCQHTFCRTCFVRLVKTSLKNEYLFPPRCCSEPLADGADHPFLSERTATKLRERRIEYGTAKRTYCSHPKCRSFIPPYAIRGDIAYCTKCHRRTCVECKEKSHMGPCHIDDVEHETLHLGRKMGWRRCFKCGHLLEKESGCDHITCTCGYALCYVCGKPWLTCRCYDYRYLNGTACGINLRLIMDRVTLSLAERIPPLKAIFRKEQECPCVKCKKKRRRQLPSRGMRFGAK